MIRPLSLSHVVRPLESTMGAPLSGNEWSIPILTSVGSVLESLFFVHDILILSILLGIMVFVMVIFGATYVIQSTNFKLRHSKELESILILFPLCILFLIGSPSTSLLYTMESDESTIGGATWNMKSVGHQWFWTYSTSAGTSVLGVPNCEEVREAYWDPTLEGKYALQTGGVLEVPSFLNIKNLVTGSDVMHSWALPSYGLKIDAIPGRLNGLSFLIQEPSTFLYGQCSELCGVNHAFMPICLMSGR